MKFGIALNPNIQPGENYAIPQLIAAVRGPMAIVAGPSLPPTDGRAAAPRIDDDPILLEKTKTVRQKGERLIQLMARTGIGLDQLRRFSRDEVVHFCEVAAQQEDSMFSRAHFEPKPMPSRISVNI